MRAEVLGALVNSVFLVALCFSILVESLKRMVDPEGISRPLLVLGIGVAGLLVNLLGICIFQGDYVSIQSLSISLNARKSRLF